MSTCTTIYKGGSGPHRTLRLKLSFSTSCSLLHFINPLVQQLPTRTVSRCVAPARLLVVDAVTMPKGDVRSDREETLEKRENRRRHKAFSETQRNKRKQKTKNYTR